MTLRELTCALKGYNNKRREEWEMHRLTGYMTWAAFNGDKENIGPRGLYPFWWEKGNTPSTQPPARMHKMTADEIRERYKKAGMPAHLAEEIIRKQNGKK